MITPIRIVWSYLPAFILCILACISNCVNSTANVNLEATTLVSSSESDEQNSRVDTQTTDSATQSTHEEIIKNPTVGESVRKLTHGKWRELSKRDAWNLGKACTGLCIIAYCSYRFATLNVVHVSADTTKSDDDDDETKSDDEGFTAEDYAAHEIDNAGDDCPVCCDKRITRKCVYLTACQHFNCKTCARSMVQLAIKGKNNDGLACLICKKKIESEDDFFDITGGNKEKANKLLNNTLDSSLATEAGLKQCPTPDCSFRFIAEADAKRIIKCESCKKSYCTSCLVMHATNIGCEEAAEEAREADNRSLALIAEQTRPCPQCKTRIQKNDGCKHMTCQKSGCKHHFCWDCGKPFYNAFNQQIHGYFDCPNQSEWYKRR